jgi:hypothetical protein
VAERSKKAAERQRRGIAGQPPGKHEYGVAVTTTRRGQHRPRRRQSREIEPGPRWLRCEQSKRADALNGGHPASMPQP